ncbi:MAG: FkbM family methyltransferase [Candidatus Pacebacteria bacterium]|nr:FkbM family methyltransferase [Candidatus Paceibacterota bacterium]
MKSTMIFAMKKLGLFKPLKQAKLWREARTRGLMDHYSPFLKKGDLCLDIGANMGARSEIFLGLGARVVALEPQEKCAEFIRSTFDAYPITVVEKAVGKESGSATLHFSEDSSVLATLSSQWQNKGRFAGTDSWNKEQTVEVTTLDALIAEYGLPRFCKVDVEGFEEEVFTGLTHAIPALSFEFTREFIETASRIIDRLETLGTYEYNYSIGERHALKLAKWVNKKELFELLAQESDADLWGDIYARLK